MWVPQHGWFTNGTFIKYGGWMVPLDMCGGFLKWGYPKPPLVSILKWSSMTWMIWGTPILGTPHIHRVYYVLIL